MNYRIIITEDHPLFRSALRNVLRQAFATAEIFEACSLEELQHQLETTPAPDLILLDLQIPGTQGLSGLLYLRGQYPEVPVVVVSAKEDPSIIYKVLEYGASGFIPKSSPLETLTSAIASVLDGDIWTPPGLESTEDEISVDPSLLERIATLTPQQFKVLAMLRDGLRNKQIAWELNVSEACIKAHATAIFRKLGVNNRTQAVITLQQLERDPVNEPA